MLKQRARLVSFSIYLIDLSLTVLSFLAAYHLRTNFFIETLGPIGPFQDYSWLLLVVVPLWSLLLLQSGLYESQRTNPLWREILTSARVTAVGTVVLTAVVFALKAEHISRLFLLFFGGLNVTLLALERTAIRLFARTLRVRGLNTRNVVIVGTGRRARELARVVEDHRHWGLRLVGFISDNPDGRMERIGNHPVIGKVCHIHKILHNEVVDELIFAVSRKRLEEMEEVFLRCEEEGVRTRVAVNFFPHMIAKVHLEDLHGIPLLTFSTTPHDEALLAMKRVFDLAVASLLLILSAPLIAVLAVAIPLTSPGPVLFRQTRVGLNGRLFTLYKFRSMYADAEERKKTLEHMNEMSGPVFKMTNDPRATPLGRWLRRTSLDELPQILNILRGDMSLVGPRPPLPSEVSQYEHWQRRRLSMKPGLTCLWQIKGRNAIRDFDRWMELDLAYIDNWSFRLDLQIFLRTIVIVLVGKGAS